MTHHQLPASAARSGVAGGGVAWTGAPRRVLLRAIRRWCVGLLLLVATLSGVVAAPVVTLAPEQSVVPLAGASEFVVDRGGRLSPEALESGAEADRFALRPDRHQVLLVDGDVLWIRFSVRGAVRSAPWLLEVDLPGVDAVTLYHRDATGRWVTQHAGDSLPQSEWVVRGRQPFLSLDTGAGEAVTYLLRVQHARVPFSGRLYLKTPSVVVQQEQRAMFLLGGYFGLAALAVLVALANALVYRDRAFGVYAVYVAAMVLGQAGLTGAGGMLIWPEWPGLNAPATFFMPLLAGATGAWFVRIVATPRQYSVLLDRLAVGVILALLAVSGFDMLVPSAVGFDLSMNLLTLSMVLVMLLLGLAVARGDRHSRWIAAGFALILIGGVFPLARNFGLLSSGFLSEYGLMLGSALEMPLLFYGLHRRLTEQTETRARAQALAVTDPLTGLASQRRLLRQLRGALERARPGRPFALLVVELANLPALVRQHGREGADRALVLAATRIKAVARDGDTVARVDEAHFALLVESPCSPDEAGAIATHVIAQGLRESGVLPVGESLRFHVALGILPASGQDAEGVLQSLLHEVRQIAPDARKTIRTARFDA